MCARQLSPILSIVLTGRNGGEKLTRCLDALKAIKDVDGTVEVLYIDMGSTDASLQEARKRDAHAVELSNNVTLATAHTVGWRTSRGTFILFIDTLAVIRPEFVHNALAAFKDPNIAVVCGRRGTQCASCSSAGYVECCEDEAMVRRDAIDEVHGFEKGLLAGDLPDLCRRIRSQGNSILKLKDTMIEPNILTASQRWKRAIQQGIAYAQVSKRYASSTDQMWLKEAHRNLWQGATLLIGLPALMITGIILGSWLPIFLGIVFFFSLIIGTYVTTRIPDWSWQKRLCYSVRTTLAQAPIFLGQMRFRFFT